MQGVDGKCQSDIAHNNHAAVVKGHADVPTGSNSALLQALTKQPVSVGVCATMWQFYFGGVFSGVLGHCGQTLDHGVLAVGYDLTDVGGIVYHRKGTITIKNSWGKGWGEKGYIRLAIPKSDSASMCGITHAASYPLV